MFLLYYKICVLFFEKLFIRNYRTERRPGRVAFSYYNQFPVTSKPFFTVDGIGDITPIIILNIVRRCFPTTSENVVTTSFSDVQP